MMEERVTQQGMMKKTREYLVDETGPVFAPCVD